MHTLASVRDSCFKRRQRLSQGVRFPGAVPGRALPSLPASPGIPEILHKPRNLFGARTVLRPQRLGRVMGVGAVSNVLGRLRAADAVRLAAALPRWVIRVIRGPFSTPMPKSSQPQQFAQPSQTWSNQSGSCQPGPAKSSQGRPRPAPQASRVEPDPLRLNPTKSDQIRLNPPPAAALRISVQLICRLSDAVAEYACE